MSIEVFVAGLASGAALLALWLHARFPNVGPSRLGWTIVHLGAAGVLLFSLPDPGASVAAAFAVALGGVLPALVYVFLASIWLLRLVQAAVLSRY